MMFYFITNYRAFLLIKQEKYVKNRSIPYKEIKNGTYAEMQYAFLHRPAVGVYYEKVAVSIK